MNLEPYVENIRHQLLVAAEAGGEEARAVADRLVAPLEPAIRLAVQDALATAADEITLELAPGSVELRLRGREPEFVVNLPPQGTTAEDTAEIDDALASGWRARAFERGEGADGDEAALSRINLRLPERLARASHRRRARTEGSGGPARTTHPARRSALYGLGPLGAGDVFGRPARRDPTGGTPMQTFDTPEPISVTVELGVGDVRIVASDRHDTVVDVQPSDPARKSDVSAAQQARVELANGNLLIKALTGWRQWTPWGGHESIDVRIELPAGSAVRGSAGVAGLHCIGRIGECRYRTGAGDIALERTGPVALRAGAGDITVDVIEGRAEIKTAGAVRIGRIDGSVVIKNLNGDTWIGQTTGEARVNASNGAISVDLAHMSILAKTANGDVSVGEVVRGPVVAQSAYGTVEIGVRSGVPAWLELETKFGHVRNDLDAVERPDSSEDAVEVHAHTSMGDIAIHRSLATNSRKDQT